MLVLIYLSLAFAVAGSVAMLGIHVASLFGIIGPFDHSIKFLGPVFF